MSVQPSNPFPLLVVAGMPRAGTTFLYHYLQQHPSIYLAFRKEIDYFNAHYHFKGRDWFASLFRGIKPGQIAGDLSPACWNDPQAPEWIREFNPDTKVILCLRDPAEFAVSLFRQKNHSHYDVPPTLEQWLHDGYESRLTEEDLFSLPFMTASSSKNSMPTRRPSEKTCSSTTFRFSLRTN